MKNILKVIALISFMAVFTACSDDEPTKPKVSDPASFVVNDQMISQNTIMVETATFEKDGWIVVHANNEGSPVVPDIISTPVLVKAGTKKTIMIPLTNKANMLNGNTQVWVMLHTDDGVKGSYDFDGKNGLDAPLKDTDGAIIMKPILLSPAEIVASSQKVTNSVTVSVTAAADGWLVIHNDKGDGTIVTPGIIGKKEVKKGLNNNIVVELDKDVVIVKGQKLFPMLHIDKDPKGEYNFPGDDATEVFGFDKEGNPIVIVTSIITL